MTKRDKKKIKEENIGESEEVREVRHTISAQETFTLAKDVFDLRCFFRNIYANRAVIARRLNIFSIICSLIFTMIYAAYNIWNITHGVITFGEEITVYILLGIYVVLIAVLIVVIIFSGKANTKTLKKYNRALKIFRLCLRLVSIAMAIAGIVVSASGGENALNLALRIVLIVISIICIIIQSIPMLFGGIVKLVRWATSPAGGKMRFSTLLLEWYEQVLNGNSDKLSVNRVSQKYVDDIGRCIDGYLIPEKGKRKIKSFDASSIFSVIDAYPDRNLIEGIFKNVFLYAEECGYIAINPVKDMKLEGSINIEEKKPKKTIKGGIANIGKKIGKSIVDKILGNESND